MPDGETENQVARLRQAALAAKSVTRTVGKALVYSDAVIEREVEKAIKIGLASRRSVTGTVRFLPRPLRDSSGARKTG